MAYYESDFDDLINEIDKDPDTIDPSGNLRELIRELKENVKGAMEDLEGEKELEYQSGMESGEDRGYETANEEFVERLEEQLEPLKKLYKTAVKILRANGVDVSDHDLNLASTTSDPVKALRDMGVIKGATRQAEVIHIVKQAAREGGVDEHAGCSAGMCVPFYTGFSSQPCAASGQHGRWKAGGQG